MKLKVIVNAPSERICTSGNTVSLRQIYLQNLFKIIVKLDEEVFSFSVNLPEWLIYLSNFLRSGDTETSEHMTLSGEHFEAKLIDNKYEISIFYSEDEVPKSLILDRAQMIELHGILARSLCESVNSSAGRDLVIHDIGLIQLNP